MLFPILLIGILTIFCFSFGSLVKKRLYKFLFCVPTLLLVYFSIFYPTISETQGIKDVYKWVPSLGINLGFNLDALSWTFCMLISGIGALVFKYASSYLSGHKYLNRFYAYLSLFMMAMLGLVMSDNIFSLFIFWELTSISSFFLIGFNNEDDTSRKNALMALGITAAGGFVLLTGLIILHYIAESSSISYILSQRELIQNNGLYPLSFICILIGAATKSAQFPFHFWLPNAMKAPTPISAYLHSATMVKAGIYLLARFTPALGGSEIWFWSLSIVGGITMVYAALQIIFKTDLKAILAYSTIAALGVMVFLLGLGSEAALTAVTSFIVAHALYKAGLFMIVGIIDHEAHTRDVTYLSGLKKVMPMVSVAGLILALTSAGLPGTLGFITKDLMYEATWHDSEWWIKYIGTGGLLFTNILMLYAGFQAGIRPFSGNIKPEFEKIKMPYKGLWVPPLILGSLSILWGLWPQLFGEIFIYKMDDIVNHGNIKTELKIWHGLNTILLLSVITLLIGGIIYALYLTNHKVEKAVEKLNKISPQSFILGFSEVIRKFAFLYTRILLNGYLRVYLMVIISFTTILVGYKLLIDVPLAINTTGLNEFRFYEFSVFIIMVASILVTISTNSRLTSIAGLSVLGLCICLIFVFYGAPDLAMTQFTIDTLTVVLFMLVMYRLPAYLTVSGKKINAIKIRDAIIAGSFGLLISIIALQVLVTPAEKKISDFYGEYAYSVGKGKNVVNVILVDFRGFDTMIETMVLSIAAIGVYSMLKIKTTGHEQNTF